MPPLKLMGLATAAGVVPAADRELSRPAKVTPGDANGLDHLTDRYQSLYHSTAPTLLMTPVVAHLETVGDFLRLGGSGPLLRRLVANQTRVAGVLRPERLPRRAWLLQPGPGVGAR